MVSDTVRPPRSPPKRLFDEIEEQKLKQLNETEHQKFDSAIGELRQALIDEDKKVKPLDLSHVSTPAPQHAPNPTALFEDKPVPYVSAAIKLLHEKFATLGAFDSAERQIKMLLPFNVTTIVTWGEPGVSQEAEMVTKVASFIKTFSELRGNELCESALTASTQTSQGFFQRLTGGHGVIGYKPNLIALKTQLITMLPTCDDYITKVDAAHQKLNINLAALSSAAEAVGDIQDSTLSIAIDNRRRILAQCVMQGDLSVQQLKQAKTLMVDQMSRCSQLLDVTIPAVESAKAAH